MADYSPINGDGFAITLTAGAAITARQLVKVSADDTVIPTSAAADLPVGVAAHDAGTGQRVTVILLPGYLHELPVVNTVAITAGAVVNAAAGGRVDIAAGTNVGTCVRGATGNAGGTAYARVIGV
jgi:hypothetical protein